MFNRCIAVLLLVIPLIIPIGAGAVYFPAGIDWTNPSQSRFVQSLYLNMLGRAPQASESQDAVQRLRRNDNRTARLRIFESLAQSSEYQRAFNETDNNWQVFQAPDYNYSNGEGYYRYQASRALPSGFTRLSSSNRSFTESIATSIAHYYNAYCYRGEPCIDNPELARDRTDNALVQTTPNNAHACAESANLNSQFKWVAINGTTYPRGIDRDTICIDEGYFTVNQLALERYDCNTGYTNCSRNRTLDLRASRSGSDNDGHPSFFFRDGSRLALIRTETNETSPSDDSEIFTQPTDPLLVDDAHACADPSQTNSRFTWKSPTRSAETNGVGTTTICMNNYYYKVQGMTLSRYNCETGFVNCLADPSNNLTADNRSRIDGKPALSFPNGTSVILTARDLATPPGSTTTQSRPSANREPRPVDNTQRPRPTTNQRQTAGGSDCANSKKRLSQFRWISNGLSSWPDGIDGRIICLNNSYYEITRTNLRNFSCQRNYTNCTANPAKTMVVREVSQDGTVWTLGNGDQVTLVSK